jgi:branched-chain amino acid transport system permease protein
MAFFLETLLGGLMAGMLYSLVALGFVLIFKASGVFNFAQGAMVLFAALAMARFSEWVPAWFGPRTASSWQPDRVPAGCGADVRRWPG